MGPGFMSPTPVKALGLVLLLSLIGSSCSILRNLKELKAGRKEEAAQPSVVNSRLDSLWREQLPADTILLTPRKDDGSTTSESIQNIWREPGSADLDRHGPVPGYRVQLASDEKKEELEPLLLKVEREMKIKAYLEYHGGRYTLRIGDFIDKAEAEIERKRAVSFGYKHAWVVQTKVSTR